MINVTKTYLGDIEQFKRYVEGIYARGWLTNHGPLAEELTERLKDYLGGQAYHSDQQRNAAAHLAG
ncbi:hypothetical protein BKM20_04765 [Pseudomonas avellanae]|uniref:Aminotransferase, DegT/DnrJ/EryC1/StrS protein n=3 Tax=Pseudomonas syringae group TaxID=136849 RepID=A0A3M2WNC8_PSEA0|nr:aminotransferase, DegT/DnrJ/EryC1/StrS family protein [Pseudomonas amygdali pv. morsprunorum str. M302280]KWS55374.1 hypothetical protein AL055_08365 [Pseudomonas amygdali pv. morsprunorum]PHN41277.1 hypothetical protein AO261_16505 [Pseudomonas avellanae]SOS33593.1 hypothetical protein CFBP6411_02233 [Pseudomonas syringae group genomosp. 3]POC82738.1 hypothetical protein BKM26_26160 [Pseudomonas avellanae]